MEFSYELKKHLDGTGSYGSAVIRVKREQFVYEMTVSDFTTEPLDHWQEFLAGKRRYLDVNGCGKCTVSFAYAANDRMVTCVVGTGGDGSDGTATMLIPTETFMGFVKAVVDSSVWSWRRVWEPKDTT